MIYELSLVTKSECSDEQVSALQTLVKEVVDAHEGEILVSDDWGQLTFAQPTSTGVRTGHYLYFIYKANNVNNVELARRFKINEDVLKSMVLVLGAPEEQDKIVKAYKCPFSKNHKGSVTDFEDEDDDNGKGSKKFTRRKSCWFMANKIKADWKDPATYKWLVNEFGKISPARVSGISRKHQRFAQTAIKRARQIGVASYVSGNIAH